MTSFDTLCNMNATVPIAREEAPELLDGLRDVAADITCLIESIGKFVGMRYPTIDAQQTMLDDAARLLYTMSVFGFVRECAEEQAS